MSDTGVKQPLHGLPELAPRTKELAARAERRFRDMLLAETRFPDRVGIVLAAGAATRFRPLTASKEHSERGLLKQDDQFSVVPWNKASLPIGDRPLLDYTLADLVASGFRYIVINVSRLNAPDSIIQAAGDGSRFGEGVAVTFSVEDQPTGTYGGVVKMLEKIGDLRAVPPETDVAIFSGDIYTEQPGYQILRYHRDRGAAFTMMLNPVPDEMKDQFGTVELDDENNIVAFHEKDPSSPSNLNNSSRYLAKHELLMRWADKLTEVPADKSLHTAEQCFFDFGLHVFSRHQSELRDAGFLGFCSDRLWADIGRISDFHEVNIEFLHSRVVSSVHPQAIVAAGARLEGSYIIGDRAIVSEASSVKDSAVGAGWILEGATVESSVLMPLPLGQSFRLQPGARLERCVLGCGDIEGSKSGEVIVFNGQELVVVEL